jgi:hypothetical protein
MGKRLAGETDWTSVQEVEKFFLKNLRVWREITSFRKKYSVEGRENEIEQLSPGGRC